MFEFTFTLSSEKKFQKLVEKYNGAKMHPYKINVMSFKSKTVLKKIKNSNCTDAMSSIQEMLYNPTVLTSLYEKWNPSLIFVTLNEIHVIKFYDEDNDSSTVLYNGNINKVLTTLVSVISLGTGFEFSGSFVEFDRDEDLLEFISLKQKEMYRNVLNFIWYKNENSKDGFTPSMQSIEESIGYLIKENLRYGVFVKHSENFKNESNWCVFGKIDNTSKFINYTSNINTVTLNELQM